MEEVATSCTWDEFVNYVFIENVWKEEINVKVSKCVVIRLSSLLEYIFRRNLLVECVKSRNSLTEPKGVKSSSDGLERLHGYFRNALWWCEIIGFSPLNIMNIL
jgi:hypothetical protein